MDEQSENAIKSVLKAISFAIIFTLIGLVILTVLVTITDISEVAIKGINQFIKIVSVFIGCMFSFDKNKGYIKGLICGVIYTCAVYLIFLIFGGNLTFKSFIIDLVCSGIVGFISGIIAVNVKKKEE